MYLTNISIFVEKKAHPILSLIKTYITRNYFFSSTLTFLHNLRKYCFNWYSQIPTQKKKNNEKKQTCSVMGTNVEKVHTKFLLIVEPSYGSVWSCVRLVIHVNRQKLTFMGVHVKHHRFTPIPSCTLRCTG